MLHIQIDGTFSFSDNIKELKLNDEIKLITNPNNRFNSEAIGAYTLDNKKIGYIPFTKNQIDINSKYKVSKIQMTQDNPLLIISREIKTYNIININNNKILGQVSKITSEISQDLRNFHKYLAREGHEIVAMEILYVDENFIDILIKTLNEEIVFYTVTKKYYNENIFIYDEFYNLGLIPKNIYQPFQIHRLEEYIKKKYKPIEKIKNLKSKVNDIIISDNLLDKFSYEKNISLEIKYGLCYNHKLKAYCYINYNDEIICEIDDFNKKNLQNVLLKMIVADKNIINILYKNTIYKKKFDL